MVFYNPLNVLQFPRRQPQIGGPSLWQTDLPINKGGMCSESIGADLLVCDWEKLADPCEETGVGASSYPRC